MTIDDCSNNPNQSLFNDGNQSPDESSPAETLRFFIRPVTITPPSPPRINNVLFPLSPPIVINEIRTLPDEEPNNLHLAASSLLSLNNPVSRNTELRNVAAESLLSLYIPTSQDTPSPPRFMHNCFTQSTLFTPPRSSFSSLDPFYIEPHNIQVSFNSPDLKQMVIGYEKNQIKKHRPMMEVQNFRFSTEVQMFRLRWRYRFFVFRRRYKCFAYDGGTDFSFSTEVQMFRL